MPLATGMTVRRPPSPAAAAQYRGYVSENAALEAALAGCPDGEPVVVENPPGAPAGFYPACGATGVFYLTFGAALEDFAELVFTDWLPELWP